VKRGPIEEKSAPKTRELSSTSTSNLSRPPTARISERKQKGPEHRSGPFSQLYRQFGYAFRFTIWPCDRPR
jgi:hypothetical protein